MEAPFYSLFFLHLSVPREVSEDVGKLCSREKEQVLLRFSGSSMNRVVVHSQLNLNISIFCHEIVVLIRIFLP
jgi:hypothetical protein